MPRPVVLDISRTVARARLPAPTGIDRVERAYLRWALDRDARFLAAFDGWQYLVGPDAARRLTGWLDGATTAPPADLASRLRPRRDPRLRRAQALIRREALGRARAAGVGGLLPSGAVYLNVGHDNLDTTLMGALGAAGVKRAVLIHDTIPLDQPEFARRGSVPRFRARLDAAGLAEAILCNSRHTAGRVAVHLPGVRPHVAPLGIDPSRPATPRPGPSAFLCLGTIEPRKNHALLLDIWAALGPEAPHLRIAGRRGWENAEVFRRLDTDPAMGRTVHEIGTPDDAALAAEIAPARAVLFPSRAEGYGLPLAEALASGTPVIASDLPALREIGADVPEWLSPDDPAAWRRAIEAYAADPSPERDAQLARLARWQAPTWAAHFTVVENVIAGIAA